MGKILKTTLLVGLANVFVLLFMAGKAYAARFYFNPASGQFNQTCSSSVDVYVDTEGQASNAADIEIHYDPNQIDILDSNSTIAGTQIGNGVAYESYFGNEVDASIGRIRLAGGSFVSTLNGNSRFATIQFKSKAGVTATTFTIKFDGVGNTLDSNVAKADTSTDILTSVTNGSYTFVTGSCVVDATGPTVTFVTPTSGEQNVAAQAPVTVKVSDPGTGVDLSTVSITINGQTFTSSSPGVTVTGTAGEYTFTIDGTAHPPFPPDSASNIRVDATDLSGNFTTSYIQFNVPVPPDTGKPYIEFIQPTDLLTEYNISNPLIINVYDYESGIDINAVEIYVNDKLIVKGDPAFSYTGTPASYTITLNNYLTSPLDKLTKVKVVAVDFAGNRREALLGRNICLDNTGNTNTNNQPSNSICIGGTIPIPSQGAFKDFLDQTGPVGVVATISALGFLLTLLPWLNLLNAPALLLNFFAVLFKKRSNKSWGLVYDKNTLKIIPLATVRAYSAETTNLVGQTVSDMNGRYRMLLPQGKYRVEAQSPGYHNFVQDVEVDGDGRNLSLNIAMYTSRSRNVRNEGVFKQIYYHLRDFIKLLNPILLVIGFVLSLFALAYQISLVNVLICLMYLIVLGLYMYMRLTQQKFGHVIDSENGYRIPAAVIKVYDPKTMEVVESLVTNALGQFDFFGDPGEYLVLVAAWGYNFPSVKQKDYPVEDRGVAKFLRIKLNSGRNRVRILLDPRSGDELISQVSTGGSKFAMKPGA